MDSNQIRQKFLAFFEKKGHTIVPSSSLVPENDSSVLFTTAGMQQFKPYYLGESSPYGQNAVSVQKCVRTGDIDEVGDDTHLTFFEMLGNFSFGGYWKKEAIQYAHEFITKELGLTIDYVSVFKDEESGIPADEESRKIWQEIDPNLTIKDHNSSDNFWGPTGNEGPCGPTTEIYINGVEIWNIVFNEFYKTVEGKYEPLKIKGIDTGMGLERLLVQVQKKSNVYETDLFEPITELIPDFISELKKRIITDHTKTSTFLISDGVLPSNKEQGYILRRLLRRMIVSMRDHGNQLFTPFGKVIDLYKEIYHLDRNIIFPVIKSEADQFQKTLDHGIKEFERVSENKTEISGSRAMNLYTSHGLPIDVILDLAKEKGIRVDLENFHKEFEKHQELSRTASAGMFKGGLANHEPQTIKLHTAHHLLLAALQEILGKEVKQRGSNITEERLRIDFAFDRKVTDEEKKQVEDIVNKNISRHLKVTKKEMPKEEAEKLGAEMEFGAKYGDVVSVYTISPSTDAQDNTHAVSIEFCGGPHVENTGELGHFKIQKEEASSAGVRRIKAILE